MRNNPNFLKNEWIARQCKKEESYNVVGVEIKDRRLTLSRTLSSLSSEICSVSYLCKIENNKIIPNRYYLKEICKRLQMKDDKVKTLLNLRITLERMVKAFLCKRNDEIREAFESGNGLYNYRYKIIEFIYYISIKDMAQANQKAGEILRLVSTMTNNDLSIFSLFYGILSFYNQDFDMALEDLKALRAYSEEILILQTKYKFFVYFMLNHPCCIFEYQGLIETLLRCGFLEEIDEIQYIMGLYLLRNKYFMEYKRIFKLIHKPSYRRSLLLLAKLIVSPGLAVQEAWIENVEPFFYYLGLIKIRPAEAEEKISAMNDLSFSVDFNLIYLQYMLITDDGERYKFICTTAFPTIERTNDGFAKEYFLQELSKISSRLGRYKLFHDAYQRIRRREK